MRDFSAVAVFEGRLRGSFAVLLDTARRCLQFASPHPSALWQELVADLEQLAASLNCHLLLYDYEGYSTSRLEGTAPSEVHV